MKKVVCLFVLIGVIAFFVVPALAQEEGGEGMEKGMMHKMGHDMMPGMMKGMKHGGQVGPQELAGYDEKTRAAWVEIQNAEYKKRIGAALSIGAAIAIGIAAMGGAIGQGKTAAAAMEGIARNPESLSKMFMPFIVAMALIESLVIYALVIAFQLQGKL